MCASFKPPKRLRCGVGLRYLTTPFLPPVPPTSGFTHTEVGFPLWGVSRLQIIGSEERERRRGSNFQPQQPAEHVVSVSSLTRLKMNGSESSHQVVSNRQTVDAQDFSLVLERISVLFALFLILLPPQTRTACCCWRRCERKQKSTRHACMKRKLLWSNHIML